MDNTTAKVSCFARAYHTINYTQWIFRDENAKKLLGDADYNAIADNMAAGIGFFCPGFQGSKEEALTFIVDNQLSPSVLGRSAFNEKHLNNEILLGATQYLLFAAGYDTAAYRSEWQNIKIFECDLPEMIADKAQREKNFGLVAGENRKMIGCDLSEPGWQHMLKTAGYCENEKTYCSLLGISYYVEKDAFSRFLALLSGITQNGSALCLDYPLISGSDVTEKNEQLADGAGEGMKAKYTADEMEALLAKNGFLIYEQLDAEMMTAQYFEPFNCATGKKMAAPAGVAYLLAVKQ